MDHAKALNIVSTLANGVNPTTGEVFAPDSPYQSPEIVRALFLAARALEGGPAPQAAPTRDARSRGGQGLANVGKPWTAEEDERLVTEFAKGRSPRELAAMHSRTLAGVEARLEKLGRITAQQRVTTNRYQSERSAASGAGKSIQR